MPEETQEFRKVPSNYRNLFAAVLHVSLSIPIIVSLFLPWHDQANYFETYFRILPNELVFWDISHSILSLFFLLLLLFVWGLSGYFHIKGACSNDLSQSAEKLRKGILTFLITYYPFLVFVLVRPFAEPNPVYGVGAELSFMLWVFYNIIYIGEFVMALYLYSRAKA